MSIKIITDSSSDITQEQAKELDIIVVPISINFGEENYLDGISINSEEFYKKLTTCKELPKTSQPSPDVFLSYFNDAKSKDDEVIVLPISQKLSGTIQSARLAAEISQYDKIYIMDSENVIIGLKCLVLYAVELVKNGLSAQEIIDKIKLAKEQLCIFACIDTLEYLKRGGRISHLSAIAGTLLYIKPIATMKDGEITILDKVRGTSFAYEKIWELVSLSGGIDHSMPYAVGYTGADFDITPFLSAKNSTLSLSDIPEITRIGATVGTHLGPKTCGIAYFKKSSVL